MSVGPAEMSSVTMCTRSTFINEARSVGWEEERTFKEGDLVREE